MAASKAPAGALLILDDLFPQPLSAFRNTEYTCYLQYFPRAQAVSTGASFPLVQEKRTFMEVLAEYESQFPSLRGRIHFAEGTVDIPRPELGYTLFLNNAFEFLPTFENSRIPFVFTLYPGGGLHLEEDATHEKARRVFGSSQFRKVIVTQRLTRDYLLERRLCAPEQIEFIFGGVAPPTPVFPRSRPNDKSVLDVCFVAAKYTSHGRDKGYDVFAEVARQLVQTGNNFRFHVVGGYGPRDLDLGELGPAVSFYGYRTREFFPEFYARMDVIVSANEASASAPGSFDGFPTGCCAEAGLSGVVVMCTDPLRLNMEFVPGQDLLLVDRDPEQIVEKLQMLQKSPEHLAHLSHHAQRAFQSCFGFERQLIPRIKLLEEALAAGA